MGILLAMLAAGFWAMTSVVTRRATDDCDRNRGLVISVNSNAIANLVIVAGRFALPQPLGFSFWGLLSFTAAGACTAFIGRWLWFRSIELVGASRASTFKNTQPLITLTFAVLFLHEHASLTGILGAAAVVAAIILLGQESRSSSPRGVTPAGVWWGLAAAVSFAAGNILRKVGVSLWPEPVAGACIGTLVAAAATWLTPQGRRLGSEALRTRWRLGEWLFALTGVLAALAQQAIFHALHLAPVWQVNAIAAVEPVLALLFAWGLLGSRESITGRLVLAVGMVCGGLMLLAVA